MLPVYAANWVYVTKSEGAYFYYDSDTIQRSGNEVAVWEKIDLSRVKTVKLREMRVRSRYDCAERARTTLTAAGYYPDGKIERFTPKINEQEEIAVIPDSTDEKMLEAVCR